MRRFLAELQTDGDLFSWGPQPIRMDGLLIYAKGYIANKSQFASELISLGSDVDEDVGCLALGYRKWGKTLNEHVFGEFAVAIYDTRLETLLLTQDCLGIVSLYYHIQPSGISFSSCIDDLSQDLDQSNLDEEYIADYLCFGSHHGERTPFKSINRLTPGISVQFHRGAIRRYRSWALDHIAPIRFTDMQDYIDELQYLVTEGVKAALPSKGVVLSELSGGLDSSTVTCIASRHLPPDRLHALSFVFSKSRTADESMWSKVVIDACGLKWHKLDVDLVRQFTELPSQRCGQPYLTMVNVALNKVYSNILDTNNVEVVLTGAGGDGVLLGDGPEPFFFADMFWSGQFVKVWQGLSQWAKDSSEPRPFLYWWDRYVFAPSVRRLQRSLIYDQPRTLSWLSSEYRLASNRNGAIRKTWVPNNTGIADSWYLEQVMRSSKFVSLRDEVNNMRAEFRNPLMYLPLVKFICATPWELKFSPEQDRLWQRLAFAKILPPEIVKRKSKGSPSQAVYSGLETGQWWKAIRAGTQITGRGYMNPERWTAAVDLARLGRCESIMHFKAAATLEIWLENLQRPASDRGILHKSISFSGSRS